MAAYATAAELAAFTGQSITAQPEDDRMLQRASDFIDARLIGAFYQTDVQGNPSDATQLAAIKNATCAQVEYWRANGDELGLSEQYEAFVIGSVSMSKGGKSSATKPRTPPLAPRAIDYLRLAGLWPSTPVAW